MIMIKAPIKTAINTKRWSSEKDACRDKFEHTWFSGSARSILSTQLTQTAPSLEKTLS